MVTIAVQLRAVVIVFPSRVVGCAASTCWKSTKPHVTSAATSGKSSAFDHAGKGAAVVGIAIVRAALGEAAIVARRAAAGNALLLTR